MKKIYKLISAVAVVLSAANGLKAQTYCIPSVSSPTNDDDIRYVMFGTMTNTTSCNTVAPGPGSIGGAYSNFTGSTGIPNLPGSVPAPVAIMGNSYPVQVGLTDCLATPYNGIFGVYIDYNQDGAFTGAELVWTSPWFAGAVSPAFGIAIMPGVGVTIPFSATPGLTRLRYWESEVSSLGGPCAAITWGETEDYVINIVPPTPCSTTPIANSIVSTTNAICPNSSTPLSLSTTYTVGAIGYQWSYSTGSAFGPYTVIPTPTTQAAIISPALTQNAWFQLNTWCANGGATLNIAPVQVSVSPVVTANVPYYEGFEGIVNPGDLPNCSWQSTGGNAQTYIGAQSSYRTPHTGNKYAAVYGYNLSGTNYFYTNGIYMYPGVTYSASIFWTTEIYGYTNFTELSLKLGTSQTPAGLVNIATQSVAVSPVYKELANTFQVATAGLYYVAIKVVSTVGSYANYITLDDLSITIPCQLNTPTVGITASSNSICAGAQVTLGGTGATTYTWNTGLTATTLTDSPSTTITYMATGTNTLTNCSASATKNIVVKPTPVISIVPSSTAVCDGSFVNLVALGANSYTWNVNANTSSFLSVNPSSNTSYQVQGAYSNNPCTSTASQLIVVNPLPNVIAANSPPSSCAGAAVILSGTGATTYTWISNSSYAQGNPVTVTPMTSVTYSLTGTDDNGCTKVVSVNQSVSICTGINEHAGTIAGLSVYPNPNNGEFTIELNNGLNKTYEISDVTGRLLFTQNTVNDKMNINMNNFSNGVYYVKVKTNNSVETLKVVKQ